MRSVTRVCHFHICVQPLSVAMLLSLLKRPTPLMEEQEEIKKRRNLASVEWTSKLITLPVWEPRAPESGKRETGLK